MNKFTALIVDLLTSSDTPIAPEPVLKQLLELYMAHSCSALHRQHHQFAADRLLSLVNDYIAKGTRADQDARDFVRNAMAQHISAIPASRLDREGSFADLLRAFYSFYPKFNIVQDRDLQNHLGLIDVPFSAIDTVNSLLTAVESRRLSEMRIPGFTERWQDFWVLRDEHDDIYNLQLTAKTFSRVFLRLPETSRLKTLNRLLSYLNDRSKLKSFAAQVLRQIIPELSSTQRDNALKKIATLVRADNSLKKHEDLIILFALFPLLNLDLRNTLLLKFNAAEFSTNVNFRENMRSEDIRIMHSFFFESLPAFNDMPETLAPGFQTYCDALFRQFSTHIAADLLKQLVCIFPRLLNISIKNIIYTYLNNSSSSVQIFTLQREHNITCIAEDKLTQLMAQQITVEFEQNHMALHFIKSQSFIDIVTALNQYPEIGGNFPAKLGIFNDLLARLRFTRLLSSIQALCNRLGELGNFIANLDIVSSVNHPGQPLPSHELINRLLALIQAPQHSQARIGVLFKTVCVTLSKLSDLIPTNHQYITEQILALLKPDNANLLFDKEMNAALKNLACIMPKLEPVRAELENSSMDNGELTRPSAFKNIKVIAQANKINVFITENNDIDVSAFLHGLLDIIPVDLETSVTMLTFIQPFMTSSDQLLTAHVIARMTVSDRRYKTLASELLKKIFSQRSLHDNIALAKQLIPHFTNNAANFVPLDHTLLLKVLVDTMETNHQSGQLQPYFVAAYLNYLKNNKRTHYKNIPQAAINPPNRFFLDKWADTIYNLAIRDEQIAASPSICYLLGNLLTYQQTLTILSLKTTDATDFYDIIADYAMDQPLNENDFGAPSERQQIRMG